MLRVLSCWHQVAISLGLLRREMERSSATHFVIDGFPRNFDNLEGWDQLMTGVADVDAVLYFDVPADVMQERMLKRGAEGSGRSDDNVAAAAKRATPAWRLPLILISEQKNTRTDFRRGFSPKRERNARPPPRAHARIFL